MFFAFESLNLSVINFQPILRSLGIWGRMDEDFEFPSHTSVNHWEESVALCYFADNASYRKRSGSLKVVEIRRYRNNLSQHEYIVAHVTGAWKDRFLRIERFEEDVCHSDPPGQPPIWGPVMSQASCPPSRSPSASPRSSASSSAPTASFNSLGAQDVVTSLNGWPDTGGSRLQGTGLSNGTRLSNSAGRPLSLGKKQSGTGKEECKGGRGDSDNGSVKDDFLIEKVRFTRVTLLDLVLLSKVVHDNGKRYQIFKRQCYWFVDMIMAVLQSISGVSPSFQDPSLVASHGPEAVAQELDPKSRTFKNVKIHQRRQDLILQIEERFRERKAAVLEKIRKADNGMEAVRALGQEIARVSKAERREMEERKRAEAAEKQVHTFRAEIEDQQARIRVMEAHLHGVNAQDALVPQT